MYSSQSNTVVMAYSAIEKDVHLLSSIHTIHICSTGNGHAAYVLYHSGYSFELSYRYSNPICAIIIIKTSTFCILIKFYCLGTNF